MIGLLIETPEMPVPTVDLYRPVRHMCVTFTAEILSTETCVTSTAEILSTETCVTFYCWNIVH